MTTHQRPFNVPTELYPFEDHWFERDVPLVAHVADWQRGLPSLWRAALMFRGLSGVVEMMCSSESKPWAFVLPAVGVALRRVITRRRGLGCMRLVAVGPVGPAACLSVAC